MLMCIKTLACECFNSANTPLEPEELHASRGHTAMAGKLSKKGYTNFPKIPQLSKNSGATITSSTFHTEDPQILGAKIQQTVVQVT